MQRNGGSAGVVSVDYTLVPGTADRSDLSAMTGTLNWANGDTNDKTIRLSTLVDVDTAAGLERLLVKLVSPTGGATPVIAGDCQRLYRVMVAHRQLSLTVPIQALRSADSARPSLLYNAETMRQVQRASILRSVVVTQLIGSDFQGPATGTLNWADGDADPKSIEYSIIDDGSGEVDEFFDISLSNPGGANLGSTTLTRVNLLDGVGSQQAPNAQAVGNASVQPGELVTLDGSGSNDPDGDTLGYQWTQVMGPRVTLTTPDAESTHPSRRQL